MNTITVWHGTNKQNHKKILKSGKFKMGTWFAPDEETARRYALMASKTKKSAVLMYVRIDADQLYGPGPYYTAKKNIHFKDGIYQ
jgi:hypothetical protein